MAWLADNWIVVLRLALLPLSLGSLVIALVVWRRAVNFERRLNRLDERGR